MAPKLLQFSTDLRLLRLKALLGAPNRPPQLRGASCRCATRRHVHAATACVHVALARPQFRAQASWTPPSRPRTLRHRLRICPKGFELPCKSRDGDESLRALVGKPHPQRLLGGGNRTSKRCESLMELFAKDAFIALGLRPAANIATGGGG